MSTDDDFPIKSLNNGDSGDDKNQQVWDNPSQENSTPPQTKELDKENDNKLDDGLTNSFQEDPDTSLNPICSSCKATESVVWSRNTDNNIICKKCVNEKAKKTKRKGKALKESINNQSKSNESSEGRNINDGDSESTKGDKNSGEKEKSGEIGENDGSSGTVIGVTTRKSTRKSRLKQSSHLNKTNSFKGKGRRSIFKKCVYKSPASVITPITSDSIYHNGFFYHAGDIVELTDFDESVYYAQLRGFLQDQYCEKSAAITWLLPTKSSPRDYFDPSTYILGPEEDIPRKLDCIRFVCNCPSEYFKAKNYPYPPIVEKSKESGYIWTSFGPSLIRKTYDLTAKHIDT